MGLLDVRDRSRRPGIWSDACTWPEHVPIETDRAALSTVSHAAREKLREIGEAIEELIGAGIDAGWRSSVDSFVGSTRHRLLSAFGVGLFVSCFACSGCMQDRQDS